MGAMQAILEAPAPPTDRTIGSRPARVRHRRFTPASTLRWWRTRTRTRTRPLIAPTVGRRVPGTSRRSGEGDVTGRRLFFSSYSMETAAAKQGQVSGLWLRF